MGAEPILEAISRKEQELRARLIQTRAEAQKLVPDARTAADHFRAEGDTAAAAAAESWLQQQKALAYEEAETAKAVAEARYDKAPDDAARLEAAVQTIVGAVLLGRPSGS